MKRREFLKTMILTPLIPSLPRLKGNKVPTSRVCHCHKEGFRKMCNFPACSEYKRFGPISFYTPRNKVNPLFQLVEIDWTPLLNHKRIVSINGKASKTN